MDNIGLKTVSEWYNYIPKKIYGLPLDMYIDNCNMHKEFNLPLTVLVNNSYDPHIDDYLLISVSKTPRLLIDKKLKVYQKDLFDIFKFISKYYKLLEMLSDNTIYFNEFLGLTGKKEFRKFINPENYKYISSVNEYGLILEMANLMPYETGLDVKLWLDDKQLYKKGKHWKRLKFGHNFNDMSSMTFNDYTVKGNNKYSSNIINSVKLFIDANKENLELLADEKISFDTFRNLMVIFDKKGNLKFPDNMQEYIHYTDVNDNISIVKSADSLFNLQDEEGDIMFDIWFDRISEKVIKDKNNKLFVKGFLNDDIYKLYLDKTFLKIDI